MCHFSEKYERFKLIYISTLIFTTIKVQGTSTDFIKLYIIRGRY